MSTEVKANDRFGKNIFPQNAKQSGRISSFAMDFGWKNWNFDAAHSEQDVHAKWNAVKADGIRLRAGLISIDLLTKTINTVAIKLMIIQSSPAKNDFSVFFTAESATTGRTMLWC